MKLNLFVPMVKYDAEQGIGYGVLAEEAVDKSKEIFDYETSKAYVKEWSDSFDKATDGKSKGNLRAMHGKVAAGKFTEVGFDDAGKKIPVVFKVVDPAEREKCAEGVYTGLSIGGDYIKRWADPADPTVTRYTASLGEGSLVDNPCMYGATFQFVRAAGADPELRKFKGAADEKPAAAVEAEPAAATEQPAPEKAAAPEVTKDASAVVSAADSILSGLKSLLAQVAALPGEPDTWTVQDIADAMNRILGVKSSAEWKAEMEAQAGVAATPAVEMSAKVDGLSKAVQTMNEAITAALAKVESVVSAAAQVPEAAKEDLVKTAQAVTDLKATGDELRKSITDLGGRVAVCEARPAQAGTPAKPVEKTIGGPVAPQLEKPTAESIGKFLADAEKSGTVPAEVVKAMRVYAAQSLMA